MCACESQSYTHSHLPSVQILLFVIFLSSTKLAHLTLFLLGRKHRACSDKLIIYIQTLTVFTLTSKQVNTHMVLCSVKLT